MFYIVFILFVALLIYICAPRIKCPNCGSKHFHHATNERNMEIWWCDDCGKEFI